VLAGNVPSVTKIARLAVGSSVSGFRIGVGLAAAIRRDAGELVSVSPR
jgi:hypothetical protein